MKKLILTCLCFAFLAGLTVNAQNYDNSVGLRLGWGYGGSFKHFLNESSAIEGIVNYRSFGTTGVSSNFFRITGLYQIHASLDDVLAGLQWYYGGGGYVGFWGGDFASSTNSNKTQIGIAGNIGLDYSFEDLPLNISVDWIPIIALSGGGGFGGASGGVAVRYIF